MSPIDVFVRNCLAALKRIVAASRGDVSLDDVRNEAWLIAANSTLTGKPLDLTSPADQQSIIGKLYGRFVQQMRTSIGLAARLDKDWNTDDDDSGPRLSDTLRAHDLADPLLLLEHQEIPDALDEACRRSYSQATAYAICLTRSSTFALAAYLCIRVETLNARIRHCRAWIEFQPSLFDGSERIGRDFMPIRGTPRAPVVVVHHDGRQLAWGFETETMIAVIMPGRIPLPTTVRS